jgi:hypothetical protein
LVDVLERREQSWNKVGKDAGKFERKNKMTEGSAKDNVYNHLDRVEHQSVSIA